MKWVGQVAPTQKFVWLGSLDVGDDDHIEVGDQLKSGVRLPVSINFF